MIALAGFLLIVAPPLLWLFGAAARAGLEAAVAPSRGGPWIEPYAAALLARSLLLALATTGGAILLGLPVGIAVARADLPGRRALRMAALLALATPPTAAAIGWSLLLAPGSRPLPPATPGSGGTGSWEGIPEVLLVLTGLLWPVIALIAARAVERLPREWEEAARLETTAWRAFAAAAGPTLLAAVGAAALLVFLLALAEYAVPGTLGVTVYPVEIQSRFQAARDEGEIAILALPLLALILPLLALQERWLAAAPAQESDLQGLPALPLGRARPLVLAALWCVPLLAAALPLLALLRESLPPRTYIQVLADAPAPLWVSGVASGAAVGTAVPLAFLLALCREGAAVSLPSRAARWIGRLAVLPYALPGALIGVAWIAILNRPGPLGDLYGSLMVLPLCYASQFFPFAYYPIATALRRVDASLVEAARLDGASSWQIARAVVAPLLRGPLVAAGGLVGLLSLRELDATSLLRPPDGDTLGFRIHDLYHYGPSRQVAALAVIATIGAAALVAAAGAAVERLGREESPTGDQ
jgi:iron(III) transport system permease protein